MVLVVVVVRALTSVENSGIETNNRQKRMRRRFCLTQGARLTIQVFDKSVRTAANAQLARAVGHHHSALAVLGAGLAQEALDADGGGCGPPDGLRRESVVAVDGLLRSHLAQGHHVPPSPVAGQEGHVRVLNVARRFGNCRVGSARMENGGHDHLVGARPFVFEGDVDLLPAGRQAQVALRAVANTVTAAHGLLGAVGHWAVHGTDANGLALKVLTDGAEAARQVGAVPRLVLHGVVRFEGQSVGSGGPAAAAVSSDDDATGRRFVHQQLAVLASVAFEAHHIGAANAAARLFLKREK